VGDVVFDVAVVGFVALATIATAVTVTAIAVIVVVVVVVVVGAVIVVVIVFRLVSIGHNVGQQRRHQRSFVASSQRRNSKRHL
jgi:hypothetical protein